MNISVTLPTGYLSGEILQYLEELKRAGTVKRYTVCTMGNEDVAKTLNITEPVVSFSCITPLERLRLPRIRKNIMTKVRTARL